MKCKEFLISAIYIFLLFSCRKTPTVSVQENTSEKEQEIAVPVPPVSGFDFSTARVFEKVGRKEDVQEIIVILTEGGLLQTPVAESLSTQNEQDSLKGNFELVKAIPGTILFKTDSLKGNSTDFYKSQLTKILEKEKVKFSDLKLSEKKLRDSVNGIAEVQVSISFRSDNKTFATLLNQETGDNSIDENFYKIINQVKASRGDMDRLYLFRKIMVYRNDSTDYYTTDKNEYALVPLTYDMSMALHQYPNALDLSYEEHRVPVNSEQLEIAFSKISSSGLLQNIKEDEKQQWLKKCNESLIYDQSGFFYLIEPLRTCLDPASDLKNNPYTKALNELSAYSGKKFAPEDISETSVPGSSGEVRFRLGRKSYEGTFGNFQNQIDLEALVGLVNKALNSEKINGNFYLLNNPDRKRCYIFMLEEQLNVANNLFTK